jgi:hypothetical protein
VSDNEGESNERAFGKRSKNVGGLLFLVVEDDERRQMAFACAWPLSKRSSQSNSPSVGVLLLIGHRLEEQDAGEVEEGRKERKGGEKEE